MTTEKTQGKRRTLQGRVVSDKMNKTITVEVQRLVKHVRYRKYVTRSKTYKAHDEANRFKMGDSVTIQECRPMSRDKRWVVLGDQ
jgi:small subunit ribosomal protein S17